MRSLYPHVAERTRLQLGAALRALRVAIANAKLDDSRFALEYSDRDWDEIGAYFDMLDRAATPSADMNKRQRRLFAQRSADKCDAPCSDLTHCHCWQWTRDRTAD